MLVLVLPFDRQDVHPADSRYFEETDGLLLAIEGPDVDMVVSELKRLYYTVPDRPRGGRCVILKDNGLVVFDCIAEGLDIGRVFGRAGLLLDALGVTYGAELPVKAALQAVGLTKGLYEVSEYPRLLLGEIDELLQVLVAGGHADETVDGIIDLLHGESAGLEGVDVSVYAPGGSVQSFCQLFHREVHIA